MADHGRAAPTLIDESGIRQCRSRFSLEMMASEVDRWLTRLADTLSTRTLQELRSILSRAVNRAMVRDLARRNVVELTEIPQGRAGRRSKSLTAEQVDAVLVSTTPDRLHHYIVVSLLTGARRRTSRAAVGARAPRWTA